MSKAKIGDKYIIEIAEIINGGETGSPQYRISGFDKVFFDDKGLKILEKSNEDNLDYACKVGMLGAWDLAHRIMEIPIHDRAKIFGISHNQASFKDISANFTVEEAYKKYKEYQNTEKRNDIQNKLREFAKDNKYSLSEIKAALKMILKRG